MLGVLKSCSHTHTHTCIKVIYIRWCPVTAVHASPPDKQTQAEVIHGEIIKNKGMRKPERREQRKHGHIRRNRIIYWSNSTDRNVYAHGDPDRLTQISTWAQQTVSFSPGAAGSAGMMEMSLSGVMPQPIGWDSLALVNCLLTVCHMKSVIQASE